MMVVGKLESDCAPEFADWEDPAVGEEEPDWEPEEEPEGARDEDDDGFCDALCDAPSDCEGEADEDDEFEQTTSTTVSQLGLGRHSLTRSSDRTRITL